MFYFHKLVYGNLTGWEMQERFRACASVSYRWLLYPCKTETQKEQRTKFPTWTTRRQTCWLQRIPGRGKGLHSPSTPRAQERVILSLAPCHSDAGRCQGKRAVHRPWDRASTILPLLAWLHAEPAVPRSLTEGSQATPLSRCCLSCVLLSIGVSPQVARKKQ